MLITGHTGFKGSWLTLMLRSLGAELAGLALAPPTKPSLFEFAQVGHELRSVEADIRQLQPLVDLAASFRPDVVLHLAAQSVVATGYAEPVETFHTNAVGTANVLQAIRGVDSVRAVVSVTTDKVYDNPESGRRFVEEDPLGGHDPYSASKAAAELVTASYRQSFLADDGVGVATARAGNVLGGGDWTPHQLVPEVIAAFTEGREAELRHPESVRPWQHVLDALNGYLALAERLAADPEQFAGAWNFGPESEDVVTVAEVVERLVELWGESASWKSVATDFPQETTMLQLDSFKARSELDWQPRLDLERTLGFVVDWYRAYHESRDVTRKQVAGFLHG